MKRIPFRVLNREAFSCRIDAPESPSATRLVAERGVVGRTVALAVIVACLALGCRLPAQQIWTQSAAPTAQDLWSICHSNQFVAVGTGGVILTSPDGQSWTTQQSGTSNWLVAVAYCNDRYVAVGDQGIILTSPDGIAWTQRKNGGARLNGVAYSTGIYLAIGEGGTVVTSSDGVTWTVGSAGVSGWLHGIAPTYSSSSHTYNFLISGEGGALLATSDGKTFVSIPSGTAADLEGVFLAAYGTFFDFDETTVVGSGGYFARTVAASSTAQWSQAAVPASPHLYGVLIYWGGMTGIQDGLNDVGIAVGDGGTILVTKEPGGTPISVASPTSAALRSVANSGTVAVAVGAQGTILCSSLLGGPPRPVSSSDGTPTYIVSVTGPDAPVMGANMQLSVSVAGWTPMTYQWYFNGQPIAGATTSALQLRNIGLAQNGSYTATASNILGTYALESYVLDAAMPAAIAGLVDESFNPTLPGPPMAVALQSDGKLIVSGDTFVFGSLRHYGRLNADGSPDTAFNAAASAAPAFARAPWPIVQRDGKILLVEYGGATESDEVIPPFSVRLNSDGTVDSSYTPHSAVLNGLAYQDAVPTVQLGNGDYLAFPEASSGFDTSGGMVRRLLANGSIDSSFVPWTGPFVSAPLLSALDTQGRIWIGYNGVTRLAADGTQDSSFLGLADGTLYYSRAVAIATQGDQLLVAHEFSFGGGTQPLTGNFGTTRLNSDGSTDPTYQANSIPEPSFWWGPAAFAPDGSAYLTAFPNYDSSGLAVPAGGPGRGFYQGTHRNGFVRFGPSGAFDPAFSLNFTPDPLPESYFDGIIFQNSAQMIVWGAFSSLNGEPRAYLARITPSAGFQVSRLINASARGFVGTGAQVLTSGFYVGGTGTKPMLIRGSGPSLVGFGVQGTLADPQLTLFNSSTQVIAFNDNWNSDPAKGALLKSLGDSLWAFDFTSSLDLRPRSVCLRVATPFKLPGLTAAPASPWSRPTMQPPTLSRTASRALSMFRPGG